jgi:transposase
MTEVSAIGLDIPRHVFPTHGADALGRQIFSRKTSRGQQPDFFAGQARCLVALEACGGAHHWARELMRLGHSPKRGVRRGKNSQTWACCELPEYTIDH